MDFEASCMILLRTYYFYCFLFLQLLLLLRHPYPVHGFVSVSLSLSPKTCRPPVTDCTSCVFLLGWVRRRD